MKLAQWNYVGPRSTPQEVRDLRKSVFDAQKTLGQAIVHKHRWTDKDVKEGRATPCPFHDENYDSDMWDPYCFGTGILGGWDDGIITFITIADTQEDVFRVSPQGLLMHETHPGFIAPWVPNMGDDDLIIAGQFDIKTWDLLDETDRYVLKQVTPRTMRGFGKAQAGYKISQQGEMDRLAAGDPRLNVPIVFDYGSVPGIPRQSSVSYPAHITGDPIPGTQTSFTQDVRIIGLPSNQSQFGLAVRITGISGGTHIFFEDPEY
jgi:hypothetical protein